MEKQINFLMDEAKIKRLRHLTLQKHGVLHGALKEELTTAIMNHISKLEEEMADEENREEVGE